MSESMRLDAALVARGLCGGRDKAKALIAGGFVSVNGKTVTKASVQVTDADAVMCSLRERFVGRGGEKLLKVLEDMPLAVDGFCCADIGASTGGFTDCLLQHGAVKVYAIDVGHGQLAASLREDPRVVSMEGTDVRDRDAVGQQIAAHSLDLCTADVSFISLTAVWDSLTALLKPDGMAVCLIKPQFEAGRSALSKRGVVKNEKDHIRVLQSLQCFWQERGYGIAYWSPSPILGGEGNIEYVAVLAKAASAYVPSPAELVKTAFAQLKKKEGAS